ncbi:Retrovirus-related Pol polyprotein from transposon TNT 1-94 [Senna tora]|uniref:Retrovirus-related Pol polyprotein from transposon TNT 1-94 n=1 Tax=Senna tora TaxID=362788 RepID=A0A834WIC9_9FABA|nr:Retrovirus-related Pol polyprotein from transposon TNT 1-94 [Senna tora]
MDGDPGMPVPEIPQHHDPVLDIPQGHDPVPEIPRVHEPVQEIPLRRSQRERRPAISTDYHVYLGEADYDIVIWVSLMRLRVSYPLRLK